MCWKNLKYNCRILFEEKAITGNRPGDRKALIFLVTDEFPEYPRLRVTYIIDKFLNSNSQKLTSNLFIDFLKEYIKESA